MIPVIVEVEAKHLEYLKEFCKIGKYVRFVGQLTDIKFGIKDLELPIQYITKQHGTARCNKSIRKTAS